MDSQFVVFWCGILLCGLVAIQFVVAIARSLLRGYLEWRIFRARWRVVARDLSNSTQGSVDTANTVDLANKMTTTARGANHSIDARSWAGWRKFRVEEKTRESSDCVSILLAPHDGKPLPPYLPGQFVALSVRVPGEVKPLVRCYSLSDRPMSRRYRLTIKKVSAPQDVPHASDGRMSNWIHKQLKVGDLVDLRSPQGSFCIDPTLSQKLVLVAGGVGITPMMSIINELMHRGTHHSVYLFYVVREARSYPFKDHLRSVVQQWPSLKLYVFCTQPTAEQRVGVDFSRRGRIKASHVQAVLPSADFKYLLCGPPEMMADLVQGFQVAGVTRERILTEAFGAPARKLEMSKTAAGHLDGWPVDSDSEVANASTRAACTVLFAHSGKTASWTARSGSLLELAEAEGIAIDSGCRAGNCGTCAVAVKAGRVGYPVDLVQPPEPGMCLTCLAVPEGDVEIDA